MPLARVRSSAFILAALALAAPLAAQFRDDFDRRTFAKDPSGAKGWGFVTGEGQAIMDFVPGPGYATITVDATAVEWLVLQVLYKKKIFLRI